MLNRDLLLRKVNSMKEYLLELETFRNVSFAEYRDTIHNRRSVERLIQLLVECASDINAHILARKENMRTEDYRSSFLLMGDKKYLTKDLAKGLSKAAGMGNLLVHEYEKIDDKAVHKTIPIALDSFKSYIAQVLKAIEASQ